MQDDAHDSVIVCAILGVQKLLARLSGCHKDHVASQCEEHQRSTDVEDEVGIGELVDLEGAGRYAAASCLWHKQFELLLLKDNCRVNQVHLSFFSIKATFLPKFQAVFMPSSSFVTSPFSLPKATFQYVDPGTINPRI